jgi:hypothetical protein
LRVVVVEEIQQGKAQAVEAQVVIVAPCLENHLAVVEVLNQPRLFRQALETIRWLLALVQPQYLTQEAALEVTAFLVPSHRMAVVAAVQTLMAHQDRAADRAAAVLTIMVLVDQEPQTKAIEVETRRTHMES